jgi:group I intron endonuclease
MFLYIFNKLNNYYNFSSLKIKVKGSIIIYRALLKYGDSNFSLDIIEYYEPSVLIAREQYYIDLLKSKYNILKKGLIKKKNKGT